MTGVWQVLLAVCGGIAIVWLSTIAALFLLGRRYDDPTRLRDALRLLPDVIRLVQRLATDSTLPRRVRLAIVLLGAYLAMPIDLVPDFIPVVGYADDLIIVALALRYVVRNAGVEAIDRHWPGTDEGLVALKRLTSIRDAA